MKKLQNSLYITSQGAYLHKERETLLVDIDGKKVSQIPVHIISDIHCFGNVMVSPFLMGMCADNGVHLAFYTEQGRFLGRLQGRQTGNILLRKQQYRLAESQPEVIARSIIAAKINNARNILLRTQRNHGRDADIEKAAAVMKYSLKRLQGADSLDGIRGHEGEAAAAYFSVFQLLIRPDLRGNFPFKNRRRRPPPDAVNALLSFLYSVSANTISGALQGVGLDPQVGFLHSDRPGRDSLALDVLEEFRSWLIDRLVLSLINRRQIKPSDFVAESSGAVSMSDPTRKSLLQSFQSRKQEDLTHPFLKEKVPIGLLFHIQAMLMARHIRGDFACYPPLVVH